MSLSRVRPMSSISLAADARHPRRGWSCSAVSECFLHSMMLSSFSCTRRASSAVSLAGMHQHSVRQAIGSSAHVQAAKHTALARARASVLSLWMLRSAMASPAAEVRPRRQFDLWTKAPCWWHSGMRAGLAGGFTVHALLLSRDCGLRSWHHGPQ